LAHALESQKPLGLNGLVARAFAEKPVRSLAEAPGGNGELLSAADKLWQEKVQQSAAAKATAAGRARGSGSGAIAASV